MRGFRARQAARQAKALARDRLRAIAVDGKTCRGARRADGNRVHLLGAAGHGGHRPDHLEVGVEHNQTSHFTELLVPLDLAGAVVTFDALHTVRANLDQRVTDKKAQYIAVVKRNQPLLHARVRALPWRQVPAGSITREKGHGRTETRTLKAAYVNGLDFPHARQAIKITRPRKHTAPCRTSRQTVYAVTSLTSAHATAADLARLVREQWSIEAHHHIRDTTFSEDTSASRTGSGPVNLATIRAAVTAAIKDARGGEEAGERAAEEVEVLLLGQPADGADDHRIGGNTIARAEAGAVAIRENGERHAGRHLVDRHGDTARAQQLEDAARGREHRVAGIGVAGAAVERDALHQAGIAGHVVGVVLVEGVMGEDQRHAPRARQAGGRGAEQEGPMRVDDVGPNASTARAR